MPTDLADSRHAEETYLAASRACRTGRALCLSGGGVRAALFHLGAVRRLNELGILSGLDTISAVSGGSIIAAHLATRLRPWPDAGTVVEDWERRVAAPFRAFAAQNIRTGPAVRRRIPGGSATTRCPTGRRGGRSQAQAVEIPTSP
jgi:NTE family protein